MLNGAAPPSCVSVCHVQQQHLQSFNWFAMDLQTNLCSTKASNWFLRLVVHWSWIGQLRISKDLSKRRSNIIEDSFLAVFLLHGANKDTWGENRLDTFQLLNYALYLVAASHETSHTHTHTQRYVCIWCENHSAGRVHNRVEKKQIKHNANNTKWIPNRKQNEPKLWLKANQTKRSELKNKKTK